MIEAILTHDEGPVTLRLSGQLMLGVTRIYSRKAQSLFEDCRYTRENITKVRTAYILDETWLISGIPTWSCRSSRGPTEDKQQCHHSR